MSEPDVYLCERIRDALVHDPRVGSLDTDVAVVGDTVKVSGHVTTRARHDAVPAVVLEMAPNRRVLNETRVFGEPEPPGVEEL